MPLVMEEIMGVVLGEEETLNPQERVQKPSVEHAPVPQILEETVEVARLIARAAEQTEVASPCGRDRRDGEFGLA